MKKIMGLFLLMMLCTYSICMAEDIPDNATQIIVNLPSKSLELYANKNLLKEYPIAIGKPLTPTPQGAYKVIEMEKNPVWISPKDGKIIASGPENPLGYRWIGFLPLYGIHGTNMPWSIGQAVSNGCIRMQESDVEDLYPYVYVGMPISITYDMVKIKNKNNEVILEWYQDVYGYENFTDKNIYNKIIEYGLSDIMSRAYIQNMIRKSKDHKICLLEYLDVNINGTKLAEKACIVENKVYLPIFDITVILQVVVEWDKKNHVISYDNKKVNGVVIDNTIYVEKSELELLFNVKVKQFEKEVRFIDETKVSLNGEK